MTQRIASCSCGQLRLTCTGEPSRVSICHCLECQKRSGSAYAVQARFAPAQVKIEGASSQWSRRGDEGPGATFHFCATCAAIVYWVPVDTADFILVAVGAFADPNFPPPTVSVYEERQHSWTTALGERAMEHYQ
ncbi:MAG: GFA family protein [Hyphomonadaceae bacterium]